MADQTTFTGFFSPNTTPVPDQLFDELLVVLSGNQIKVLLYIIRRTYGFKKSSDTISLNQMLHGLKRKDGSVLDRGVGLSKPTLLTTLNTLVTQGIVMRERRRDAKRGNLPTCYSLKLAASQPEANGATGQPQRVGETLGQKSLSRVGQTVLPTTTNSLTTEKINVVKKTTGGYKPGKPRAQVDYLVDEIERHTGDQHSRGSFAQIASVMADHKLFQVLAEMKQNPHIRNRGAWFTAVAKQHAPPEPKSGSG